MAAGAGGGRPGGAGLQGAGGAKCKLTAAQVAELEAVLDAGPGGVRAMRISAGRWPGSRIRCGGGSGWSTRWPGWMCCCTGSGGRVQVPARRAAERDEEKIASVAGGHLAGHKSQLIWWMVAQAEIARGAGRGGLRLLPREGGACGCGAGVRGGRVVSGLPVTPAVRGA